MAVLQQNESAQMTTMPKYAAPKKKAAPAVISSKTIAEQTEAFLKAGGKIDQVKAGVSGYKNLPGSK